MKKNELLSIIDSDKFYNLPALSQFLFFHLAIKSDRHRYIHNANAIIRKLNAKQEDFKLLIDEGFIVRIDINIFRVSLS